MGIEAQIYSFMLMPVAKRQFGLDQFLVGELEIFARSAVLCREYDALQSPSKIWVAYW